MQQTEWIAVDWGMSHLRAWIFGSDDAPLAELTSEDGADQLRQTDFEAALLRLVGEHLPAGKVTPVICCGSVGARHGWVEAPYAKAPCPPPGGDLAVKAPTSDLRLDLRVIPGVSQAKPADVMRGEETQIAGLLAARPGFDGVVCLPGTHTKWVHISAGEIVSFRTFMTGELFGLLSANSLLRHGLGEGGWNDAVFAEAVDEAMSRPQGLGASLFSLRAEHLLNGLPAGEARARLSGLLIGLELAGARPYWLGQQIILIGAPGLTGTYSSALERQGAMTTTGDATATTLIGLRAAYDALKGAGS